MKIQPRTLSFALHSHPQEMDQPLCGTTFTGHKLEELILPILFKGEPGGLRLVSVEARPWDVQGYISKVLQIRLTWNDHDLATALSAPESVIVKCPTSVNLQYMLDKIFGVDAPYVPPYIRQMHNNEINVYEFLHKNGVEIPIPRIFGSGSIQEDEDLSKGVLILEDLTTLGSVPKALGTHLSPAQTHKVADTLASFHAWSYLKWSENPADAHVIPSVQDRRDQWTHLFCSTTPEVIKKCKTGYPHIFGGAPEDKMMDILCAANFFKVFGVGAYGGRLPVVLVHGDIHPLNALFSKQEGRHDELVGLIDYQMSHRGYGMEDLARLLTLGTSNEFKRKRGDDILRRYVEVSIFRTVCIYVSAAQVEAASSHAFPS